MLKNSKKIAFNKRMDGRAYTRIDHSLIRRFVARPLRKTVQELRKQGNSIPNQAIVYIGERAEKIYLLVCFILRTLLSQNEVKRTTVSQTSLSNLFKTGQLCATSVLAEKSPQEILHQSSMAVNSSTLELQSKDTCRLSSPFDFQRPSNVPESASSVALPVESEDFCLLLNSNLANTGQALQFYRLLNDLEPISDVALHLRRYPAGSDLLAIRHCKEIENMLKSWEASALSELEQCRATLLNVRNLELLLLFAEEQRKTIKTLLQRKIRHERQWKLDHHFDSLLHASESVALSSHISSTTLKESVYSSSGLPMEGGGGGAYIEKGIASEFQFLLRLNGQAVRCDLPGALQLVHLIKKRAEQHVYVRTVYVRCIKELNRINVSNLMKLYTWSLRTRKSGAILENEKFSNSRSII